MTVIFNDWMMTNRAMYLIDTNIISELRKALTVNRGVVEFMSKASANQERCYLSVITIGELYRGVGMIQHRGDIKQANQLSDWLDVILNDYQDRILAVDNDVSLIWASLRTPHHENAIDKLIAATALSHSLTLVTRNTKDFEKTGVPLIDPFT